MTEENIAIISDIHGNLPALEAVLKNIEGRGIKQIYCPGDIVGYGARPNECVELVKERRIISVLGNHDHDAIAEDDDFKNIYNYIAASAMEWTRATLTEKNKDFLREMTYVLDTPLFHLVHGSLLYPKNFEEGYIYTMEQAEDIFFEMSRQFCFIGHTHMPGVFASEYKEPFDGNDGSFQFDENQKAVVNAGSVGQSRAKDPRAHYVIFTPPGKIQYVKLEYDIPLAQKHILDASLPEQLAIRLELGL